MARWLLAVVCSACVTVLIGACGSSGGGASGTPTTDASFMFPPNDAADTGAPWTCPQEAIDLNAQAMSGTYHGTTATGASSLPPNVTNCSGRVRQMANQVMLRYRVSHDGYVSVSVTGSDVFVSVTTDCTQQVRSACQDNLELPGFAAAVVTNTPLTAGGQVLIVVGNTGDSQALPQSGPFDLTIHEGIAPAAVGAPCDASMGTGSCIAGASCIRPLRPVSEAGHVQTGTCVADGSIPGAPCAGGTTCSAGMKCLGQICGKVGATGSSCDQVQNFCSADRCIPTTLATTIEGTCTPQGQPGGDCTTSTNACSGGATCDFTTCVLSVPQGGACTPLGTTGTCATGTACVPSAGSLSSCTCQAFGAAAGTPCTSSKTCSTGLQCITEPQTGSHCSQLVSAGGSCMPRLQVQNCPTGQVCGATAFDAGQCVTPTMEVAGAHDVPMPTGAVALPVAFAGTVSQEDEVDCYAVQVPGGAAVYAEVDDGAGGCVWALRPWLTLHDSTGKIIDDAVSNYVGLSSERVSSTLFGCAILDGRSSVSGVLSAGTYEVCVHSPITVSATPPIPYVLAVATR